MRNLGVGSWKTNCHSFLIPHSSSASKILDNLHQSHRHPVPSLFSLQVILVTPRPAESIPGREESRDPEPCLEYQLSHLGIKLCFLPGLSLLPCKQESKKALSQNRCRQNTRLVSRLTHLHVLRFQERVTKARHYWDEYLSEPKAHSGHLDWRVSCAWIFYFWTDVINFIFRTLGWTFLFNLFQETHSKKWQTTTEIAHTYITPTYTPDPTQSTDCF